MRSNSLGIRTGAVRRPIPRWGGAAIAALAIVSLTACSGGSTAPQDDSQAARIAEIDAMTDPAEREAALLEGATEEGEVTWYTQLIVDQLAQPIADAFEEKYGVEVAVVRSGDNQTTFEKLYTEAQAGRVMADVVETTSTISSLREAGLITEFSSPHLADYPADVKDDEGFWAASAVYYHTPVYSTALVDEQDVPQSYEDLLDERWRGNIIWTDAFGGPSFVGGILTAMGETDGRAYLEKLSENEVRPLSTGSRDMVDLVAAGEYPIALFAFNHHAELSAEQGAPVEWLAIEPVFSTLQAMAISANGPHPYAARLLVDFILSEEGQQIVSEAGYFPADPSVTTRFAELTPTGGRYSEVVTLDPEMVEDNNELWTQIYGELF